MTSQLSFTIKVLIFSILLYICAPASAESVREKLKRQRIGETSESSTDEYSSKTNFSSPEPDSTIAEEVKDGVVTRKYPNGQIARIESYKKGLLNGEVEVFYENGNLMSAGKYKNDEPDGISKSYYENGNLMNEISYTKGDRHGLMKSYYENGQLMSEINYVNEKQDGKVVLYDKDGNIRMESMYKNGVRDGKSVDYAANGKPMGEMIFDNGKKVWEKKYGYEPNTSPPLSKLQYIMEYTFDTNGKILNTKQYDKNGKLVFER